jgi:hypothetical protein
MPAPADAELNPDNKGWLMHLFPLYGFQPYIKEFSWIERQ